MSLREKLNNSAGLTITVISVLFVGVIALTVSQWNGTGGRLADQDFYTDDDGQTYFADTAGKDVPFNHDGKDAVRAFVYRSQGKTSVHYMMRTRRGGAAKPANPDVPPDDQKAVSGRREYKRPGDKDWRPQPPGPIPSSDKSQPEWVTP